MSRNPTEAELRDMSLAYTQLADDAQARAAETDIGAPGWSVYETAQLWARQRQALCDTVLMTYFPGSVDELAHRQRMAKTALKELRKIGAWP